MSTKTQKPLKALKTYHKMSAELLLPFSANVYSQTSAHFVSAAATAPLPFDLSALKTANDTLTAATAAALDGGKQAIEQRNQAKNNVVKLLDQLVHYVELNSNDNTTVFLSSGFTLRSSVRAAATPASESIRKIELGPNSGQMNVTPTRDSHAKIYEARYAAIGAGGVPGQWTIQPIVTAKSPTTIAGLTPGTSYAFQVRVLTKAGTYTDWSDSVTRIAN